MSTAYKTGELLVIETGEYSDKSWHGPFKVAKDFDMREAAEQCKSDFKPDPDDYSRSASNYDLLDWLHKNGCIEDVECRSVHIGSYGDIEIDA